MHFSGEHLMRLRSLLPSAILCLLLALSGVGCKKEGKSSNTGTTQGSRGETSTSANEILFGEYGSMTGATATFGTSSHEGIMLAVDEINAGGGLLGGKKIRVIS